MTDDHNIDCAKMFSSIQWIRRAVALPCAGLAIAGLVLSVRGGGFSFSLLAPPLFGMFLYRLFVFPLIHILVPELEHFVEETRIEAKGSGAVYRTRFRESGDPKLDSFFETYSGELKFAAFHGRKFLGYFGGGVLVFTVAILMRSC